MITVGILQWKLPWLIFCNRSWGKTIPYNYEPSVQINLLQLKERNVQKLKPGKQNTYEVLQQSWTVSAAIQGLVGREPRFLNSPQRFVIIATKAVPSSSLVEGLLKMFILRAYEIANENGCSYYKSTFRNPQLLTWAQNLEKPR